MRKRVFDVVVISLAAIVWVPVVLLTAAAVLVLSGRPVFYRSRRWVGPGRIITMAKFRVMVRDADQVQASVEAGRFLNTPQDSPLYTPVGRALERLGVTELPQFIHVLKGDMSIVGARPLTDAVRDALRESHPSLDERWTTPAGLTGLPQLVGRHALTDAQRLHLEAAYSRRALDRYRMVTDFLILLHTVLIVLGVRRPMTFEQALALSGTRRSPVHMADLAGTSYAAEVDVA